MNAGLGEAMHVGRLSTAPARLVRQRFSLILTDLDVPDSHGPATVRHLRRAAPVVALVVLTGKDAPDVAQALGRLLRLALERRERRET